MRERYDTLWPQGYDGQSAGAFTEGDMLRSFLVRFPTFAAIVPTENAKGTVASGPQWC